MASSLINRAKERTGTSSSADMQKLWEGINQTRMGIENDQAAYEQARHEIEDLNGKIQNIIKQNNITECRIREIDELRAVRATDLTHFEIKDKVVNESIAKVQEELGTAWENLGSTRAKAMELSNRCLNESNDFAMLWNCTALGKKNRAASRSKELEELRRQKHRLEYEIETFLTMLNRVQQSEQEKIDLETQYRNQEESVRLTELEAYKRLQETDETLNDLRKQQSTMEKEMEEELNRLQLKLQEARESISYWERRVSENQRILSFQQNKTINEKCSDENKTRFGNPPMISSTGFNASVSANKSARIYQPVRPTPQISKQTTLTSDHNNRIIFQKQSVTATKPQQKSLVNLEKSANFSGVAGNLNQGATLKSAFPSSNNNNTATATTSGRVFQFKKKPLDVSNNNL